MVAIPLQSPSFAEPLTAQGQFAAVWTSFFDAVAAAINADAPSDSPTFTGTVTMDALTATGVVTFSGTFTVSAATVFTGNTTLGEIGVNGSAPQPKGTITGSRSAGVALNNLLNYLTLRGDITNATTA